MSLPRSSTALLIGAILLGAASPSQAVAPKKTPVVAGVAHKPFSAAEIARWKKTAAAVTIMRDKWGIPHVFGKRDADAVFGMLYAQAEDDFNRVELNYINALGRLAEVEGESQIWRDLRMKLYIQPDDMRAKYAASPAWLKQLMIGFADGLNYYLYTHPDVKPKLITRFEPWMALAFSEGSIGGDIESIELKDLEAFYGKPQMAATPLAQQASGTGFDTEPRGSNGFAIAPRLSASGHALLMINPHTSFYFRPEIHMVSDEGLNAYGAVTWGQFFIYQGFNDKLGWMHTSGGGDVIDEYLETVVERGGKFFYKYGKQERAMRAVPIALPYKTPDGAMSSRVVTAYFTHHGPVVRSEGGKWVSVKMMDEPLKALTQSYIRTKARDYDAFAKAMELRTNSSNNTVYADAKGNIAYFHGNFIPKRNPAYDWTRPVDGSNPATEWQGLHSIADTIHLVNPASGYLLNTNNWPCTAAGPSSPVCRNYPAYMWTLPENARGRNAARVFKEVHDKQGVTIDSLIAASYDTRLQAFEALVPAVVADHEALPAGDPRQAQLKDQIAALRGWNLRYGIDSVPTSLAIYWGQEMVKEHGARARGERIPVVDYITERLSPAERLDALARASDKLAADFGKWNTPWGEINRFQRVSGDIDQQYDDSKPSWPVAFPSANWGSLASFGMVARQTTKRIYGDRGNSFVAAVEFGPKVRAKSILAGGQSSNPTSPHFADQAAMYARGEFKDVLFYKEDIERQLERKYHPGM